MAALTHTLRFDDGSRISIFDGCATALIYFDSATDRGTAVFDRPGRVADHVDSLLVLIEAFAKIHGACGWVGKTDLPEFLARAYGTNILGAVWPDGCRGG